MAGGERYKVGPIAEDPKEGSVAEESKPETKEDETASSRTSWREATRAILKMNDCDKHDGHFNFEDSEKFDRRGRHGRRDDDDDDDDDDDGDDDKLVGDRKKHKLKPEQPPVFQPLNVAAEHAPVVVPMRVLSVVLLNVFLCILCAAQWQAEKKAVQSLERRVPLSAAGFDINTEECFVSFAPVHDTDPDQPIVARVLAPCRGSALVCAARAKLALPRLRCDKPREESAERIGRPSTRDDDHWCWNSEEGVSSITVRAPTLAVAPPGSCEVVIEWPANTTLPPVNVNLRGGSLTRAGESAALAAFMHVDKLKVSGYAGQELGGVELPGLSIQNGGSLNITLTRGHVEVYGLQLADDSVVEVRLRALAPPRQSEG